MNAQAQARKAAANPNKADNSTTANNTNSIDTIKTEITATSADDFLQQIQQQQQQQVLQLQGDCQTICLHVNIQTKSESNVVKWNDFWLFVVVVISHKIQFQVPTSDNTTVPVQIKLPSLMSTSSADGTTNTVVLHPSSNAISTASLNNTSFNSQSTLSTASLLPWQKPPPQTILINKSQIAHQLSRRQKVIF